jgi:hypothetical protein
MLRKRLKVLAERQTIFSAEALDQEVVKAKLEKQTNEMNEKVDASYNRITEQKIILQGLKRSVA